MPRIHLREKFRGRNFRDHHLRFISKRLMKRADIYIYMVTPPPGPIRALGAGVITLDSYIINMITRSKAVQIPLKNASCRHMTLNILTFQKEKNSNFLKPESGSEKGPINLQIVNPLHEKCTWPFKKLHGKQKMPYASRISASNRNNIKIQMNKCIGFWTSKCTKPAQGQKKSKFWTSKCTKPAQGQKKQKFWTSKCTKPAQGQKKQKL